MAKRARTKTPITPGATGRKVAPGRQTVGKKTATTRARPARTVRKQDGTSRPARTTRPAAPTLPPDPSHDAIAARAYDLYLHRIHGNAVDDWLRAEEELKRNRAG